MLTFSIAGFIMGFVGSLHCVGMCGPLSLAVPTSHLPPAEKFFSLLLYQSGRIITYSLLGFVFGLAGRGLYLGGLQQWFSILIGSVLLLTVLWNYLNKKVVRFSLFSQSYLFIQKKIGWLLTNVKSPSGFLLLGIANGLLPCGMVYIAMASALTAEHIMQGVGFMAAFGTGTLPAMMTVAYGGQLFSVKSRGMFKKIVPLFVTITALILILRGMNLGIPFISPVLPSATGKIISCHS
jgi:uncharacterized protein